MKKTIVSLILFIPFLSFTEDNRTKFYDLSKQSTKRPKSQIIQFFSSIDNIGNYLPVMGIHKMLGQTPDTWCAKGTIDWNYVNKTYKCGIIGGAGFFHKSFEPFWKSVKDNCKIPLIMWGIGICLPDKDPIAVDKEIVQAVAKKCDLINVRDDFTASYYGFENASVTACPCIIYLEPLRELRQEKDLILYSHHDELINHHGNQRIIEALKKTRQPYKTTNNFQSPNLGLTTILTDFYLKSRVVVTSRLHGAIIAYALGIPYIMLARDKKLVEFHKIYGNGLIVKNVEELEKVLKENNFESIELKSIDLEPLLKFAERAKAWVEKQCKEN